MPLPPAAPPAADGAASGGAPSARPCSRRHRAISSATTPSTKGHPANRASVSTLAHIPGGGDGAGDRAAPPSRAVAAISMREKVKARMMPTVVEAKKTWSDPPVDEKEVDEWGEVEDEEY